MLQKTKQVRSLLIMLLVVTMVPCLALATVDASPPGTCFVGPGTTKCSTLNIANSKDSNGNKVDIRNNCYTVFTPAKGKQTITKTDCGQDNAAKVCPDGVTPAPNNDASQCSGSSTFANDGRTCGESGNGATRISINIGCKARGNAITDALFALIRFLTNGVGVVLVASMVYAGIQYSASRGDPNGMNQAINRIRSNVFALLLFIFAYAMLNYIIPGQVFK